MQRVGPLVREHNGFIDKYIGDAVMGLFPDSVDDALRAAVALQKELRIHNAQLERSRKPGIMTGVGIHTGPLMLGTIGERERMEATVIADAVNTASRLESATKTFGCPVLISAHTYAALTHPDEFHLRRLGSVGVKGRSETVDVYECYGGQRADAVERISLSSASFAEALLAFETGQFVEARSRFAEIVASDPDDGPARYFLLRCDEAARSG